MEESEIKKLALKYLRFSIHFACWNAQHLENMFNINGKGNKELSQRQFGLMLVISESGIDTISGLEKLFHISKSSLSLTIKKMTDAGYVSKKQFDSDKDGRIFHIVLTEKGLNVLDKFRDSICQSFVEFLSRAQKDEREKFIKCIEFFEAIGI
jgi:DNA-binding MarR family transcriptional regulator